MTPITRNQIKRIGIVLISILGIILLIKYTFIYLYPFLIAAFFAAFLQPIVSPLEDKLHIPRTLATLIVLFIIFIIIIGSIVLIITELIQSTTYLADNIPVYYQHFIAYIKDFIEETLIPIYHQLTSYLHMLDIAKQEHIHDYIEQMANQLALTGSDFLKDILFKIPLFLRILPNSLTIITFIILATFFLTKDWAKLREKLETFMPPPVNRSTNKIWHHLTNAIYGFLKVQFILIILTAIIIFIGLWFLHIDHPFTIAILTALIDLLPYIGTGIVFIPWIIYLFMAGDYPLTIGITSLYMVLVIGRQLLEPKLLSSTIGLNPLTVLIGIFVGLQLLGLIGIFLAPIVLIVFKALYEAGVFSGLWHYIKG